MTLLLAGDREQALRTLWTLLSFSRKWWSQYQVICDIREFASMSNPENKYKLNKMHLKIAKAPETNYLTREKERLTGRSGHWGKKSKTNKTKTNSLCKAFVWSRGSCWPAEIPQSCEQTDRTGVTIKVGGELMVPAHSGKDWGINLTTAAVSKNHLVGPQLQILIAI